MKDKITKDQFFNSSPSLVQDVTREFIFPHILKNQSYLVNHLGSQDVDGFRFDDIQNLYMTDNQIIEDLGLDHEEITSDMLDDYRYENPKEPLEWYLVSEWFLDRIKEMNEPYIENSYGTYWGRQCSGQSIYLDYNIQELAYHHAYDERLYKASVVDINNYKEIAE